MNKIDWYERVKTDFDSMVNKYADPEFEALYEAGEVFVHFEEFEKERAIDFGVINLGTPISTLKYSEAESHFYFEFVATACGCGDEECMALAFKRRVIMDSAELLIAFIENEVFLHIQNMELAHTGILPDNVTLLKEVKDNDHILH